MLAIQLEKYNIYQVTYGVAGDGQGTLYAPENVTFKTIKIPAYSAEDALVHIKLHLSNLYSDLSFRVVGILPNEEKDLCSE
ncbi:MAG: hypothetical protein KAS32_21960 [Candidatus Peribacteraceae bacterium]|nr:hypothetical protein [Candidatus Peribacteraceae bacterium]